MTLPPTDQLVSYIVAFLGLCGAVYERLKSERKKQRSEAETELIADSKMYRERADALRQTAEENMKLYQDEHTDHQKTRDYWHEQSNNFQATMAKCQEQIAEYKARPDLAQVMRHIESQSNLNTQMLSGIQQILEQLKGLYAAFVKIKPA